MTGVEYWYQDFTRIQTSKKIPKLMKMLKPHRILKIPERNLNFIETKIKKLNNWTKISAFCLSDKSSKNSTPSQENSGTLRRTHPTFGKDYILWKTYWTNKGCKLTRTEVLMKFYSTSWYWNVVRIHFCFWIVLSRMIRCHENQKDFPSNSSY